VSRIPPNLFNVTCSALKGLLPRHSNIPTSEYIMHGSRLSARPTPRTRSYSYVHSNHPSSNSSSYLSGKHSPLRRGEIYLKSLPFCGSQHPSCVTQHPRRARRLYPRFRCQPQPPRYFHKGADLNEQSWSCSTRGTEITGSVGLTPSAPTSSDGATICHISCLLRQAMTGCGSILRRYHTASGSI